MGTREARARTRAVGYFCEVGSLEGTVVGTKLPLFHSVRSLRQSLVRPHVKLTLYGYRWPRKVSDLVVAKSVLADGEGKFDFGVMKPGHYTITIDDKRGLFSDWFDVGVKGLPHPKESGIIDISPVTPDCRGGHEFIVKIS